MAWAAPRIASSCSSRLMQVEGDGGMSSGAITSTGVAATTSSGDVEEERRALAARRADSRAGRRGALGG